MLSPTVTYPGGLSPPPSPGIQMATFPEPPHRTPPAQLVPSPPETSSPASSSSSSSPRLGSHRNNKLNGPTRPKRSSKRRSRLPLPGGLSSLESSPMDTSTSEGSTSGSSTTSGGSRTRLDDNNTLPSPRRVAELEDNGDDQDANRARQLKLSLDRLEGGGGSVSSASNVVVPSGLTVAALATPDTPVTEWSTPVGSRGASPALPPPFALSKKPSRDGFPSAGTPDCELQFSNCNLGTATSLTRLATSLQTFASLPRGIDDYRASTLGMATGGTKGVERALRPCRRS